jgi:predicted chitinase
MKIIDLLELSKSSPLGKFIDKVDTDYSVGATTDKIGNAISNVFKNYSNDKTDAPTKSEVPVTVAKPASSSTAVSSEVVAQELDRQGITDPNLRKSIMGKFGQESGGKTRVTEIPFKNTSNDIIRLKLPQLRSMSDNELNDLKQDTEKFFNRAYGYKGNSLNNNEPGDGYKYRGRGLTGITGKVNYQRADDALGLKGELVKNPDLLLDPEIDKRASVWFYKAAGADKVTFANQEDANKWAIHKAGGNMYAPGTELGNIALNDLNKRTAVIGAVAATGIVAGPTLVRKADTVIDKVKNLLGKTADSAKSVVGQTANTAKNAAIATALGSGSGGGGGGGGSYSVRSTAPEEEVTLIINGKRKKFKNKREAKIAMDIARSQGIDARYG